MQPPRWLQSLQWKHRILLVSNAEFMGEDLRLRSESREALERDLLVINLHSSTEVHTLQHIHDLNSKMHAYAIHMMENGCCAMLIGKDGTIKQQYTAAPVATHVFQLIDSMPMRLEEIQQRKAQA